MEAEKPKIFGIGLSRTGTSSLAKALEILGYKTMDFPGKNMPKYAPGDLSSIEADLLENYEALTDTPIPSLYKQLDAKYPGSKFILTVRDMDSWLLSCKRHFTEKLAEKHNPVLNEVHNDIYECAVFDEKKFRKGYDRFVKDVLSYFKKRRQDLLVMNICTGEGWEKLCPFLNKPVPPEPFPDTNIQAIQYKRIEDLVAIAKKAGKAILEIYDKEISVEYKDDNSPLTEADKISHDIIVTELRKLGYSIPILSEEDKKIPYSKRKNWIDFWLVDPLDGTKEFIKKNGEFTINIAFIYKNKPVIGVVYLPAKDVVYYAKEDEGSFKQERDKEPQRLKAKEIDKQKLIIVASRSHLSPETEDFIDQKKKEYEEVELISAGSSLKLCLVAEGKADIYPRLAPTMEWDIAAGHAIVKFAGKNVYKYGTKEELRYNKEDLVNDWFVAE